MQVVLAEVVGSPFCVSVEDGNRVHERIAAALDKKLPVEISFDGVTRLTTAFLNAAVGQLYNEYAEDEIRKSLSVGTATQDDLKLLKKIIDNAKLFFQDREGYNAVLKDELGSDE